MSEVTELTNEQLAREICAALYLHYGAQHIVVSPLLEKSSREVVEKVLRRISTQGAGLRMPNDDELLDLAKEFSNGPQGGHYETYMGLRDFYKFVNSKFFRAPSDPPRPEYTEQQRQDWIEQGIVPAPNSPIGKLVDALIRCLWLLESPGVAKSKAMRGYQIEHVISLTKAALKANGRDPHEHGSEVKR